MPLHLERESHQNCKQDPVGLKFLKCAPFFVSWIEGTSCTLLSQPTRPVLSLHHSHHKFPTFTATLHSLTTPHTPPYSYFSPHNTLSTPHSLATHSPLSHHTFLTLTPHNPHPLTTPISQHTLPSVTTNSYILFLTTPHSLYSLDAPHTSNFHIKTLSHHSLPLSFHTTHSPLSQHTTHSKLSHHTTHYQFSHRILSTLSLHTPHFLTTHSPLSRRTLPTIVPLSHPTPYSLTLPHHPDCFTTHPNFSPHFLLSYQSHFASHSPLSHHTPHYFTSLHTLVQVSNLIPHSRTSLCYRTFPLSLRSPLFHHTPPFLAMLLTLISSHPQFLTLDFLISLLILSHHHPCPQGGHWGERWGCGLWALYTGKIFAHVLFSLSPALSAGKFRTGRIPMFQLFSLVHKCDFKTRRNCLQA